VPEKHKNIRCVITIIISRIELSIITNLPGDIKFVALAKVALAEVPTEVALAEVALAEVALTEVALAEVPTTNQISTHIGVISAKEFLTNIDKFTISGIINIVNAHKDLFDNDYAKLIISMHTGLSAPGIIPNDPRLRALYGMLFNVNPTVIKFNLGEVSDSIIKKHLPLYINGNFNKKDLLIDIINSDTSYIDRTITNFAKAHFTRIELLRVCGKTIKTRIDFIECALNEGS
jgi:hypothetical protein